MLKYWYSFGDDDVVSELNRLKIRYIICYYNNYI